MVEMDELIAINVRYEGDNEASQIFQLNPKTQWRDLEAMLKVQYDCENVEVFYVDTDGDYIILSSQEELVEAFKVAQNCSSTLHLKLRNFTGQPVEPETHRGDNSLQTPGGDTDVKIMMESSVDPKSEHRQNTEAQKEQEGDSSEAELEKLEMWLHEDSKPLIRSKEVEKQMAPTVDIVTPSEDEKKEAGKVKPSDGQKDEETGVVYVKPKVMRQKVRKSEKTLEHDRMYKRRHCRSAERSRRLRYEEEAETSDDAAMPYDVFIKYMQQLKLELRTEIVRDVTRKTVKQVLKGLDGAVIQSMKGGNSETTVETPASPTKIEDTPILSPVKNKEVGTVEATTSHPIYYHEHVTCDFCERTIVGARYKCCNCSDYDLCEECEAIHGVHDPNHVFLKIRRPVRLRNKTPLLKQIIYRSSSTEHIEARQPLFESAEKLLKAKMDKLKAQLSHKQDKLRKKEEKIMRKQKRKEDRLQQWLESSKHDVMQVRHATVELLMAADFLYDVTIPDGTRVQPGTRLMKTWRIRNAGTSKWTDSTKLKVVYDCIPTVRKEENVPKLRPAEEGEITVELVAPQKPGRYQSHWKMFDHDRSFGHRVWCDIIVEPKEVLEPTKDDTFKLVQQSQQAENLHQKSEYEEIPERDVKISQKEDFLLEPSQTSFRSSEEIEKREPGEGEENIKIVMADSVAEIADKMVEFVCEQMDRSEARNVEHFMPENNNVETIAPDNEPKYVDQEKENVDSGIPVEFARHQEEVSDIGNKYESTGKSGDESDFSDGHGFLHVQGPDLIAFEMVEPGEDDKYENALPVEEEKFENAEEYLNDRKEEVQIEERHVLSRSSSVEVVDMTQDESAADEEVQDHEYLRSLQNPVTVTVNEDEDDDDDDDSMTDSSYDIYNDSEDDFLVVPMPACFNLEKPISFQQPESQSEDERGDNLDDNHNRIHVADEQTRVSVDDILTTSGTIATPPLEPEAVAMPTQEVDDKTMIKKEADLDDFFGTESVEKDNLVSASETDSEETKVVEITQHPGQADKSEEVTSPVVTTQPEGATAMEGQWDKQLEQRPAELVNQMMHTAVKAANKAAANAYTTAKEVFYTWQARTYQNASGKTNSYKPPTSSWKPKESDFKPPQSDWKPKDEANKEAEPWKAPNADYKPPKSEWKPKSDKWQPPKEAGPMAKLKEMGFCNRELNEKLLKKHNDDVETVVQELLSTTENDWMAQRH
ncbi:next to BRCA1 gene 1 protein-like [Mytilus edulis]|uniref:next to BRCA1 gene 1 protein-like n=1 Tax=Mytilus edulis TaxID=6550 RepID=UPI0039EEDD3A